MGALLLAAASAWLPVLQVAFGCDYSLVLAMESW